MIPPPPAHALSRTWMFIDISGSVSRYSDRGYTEAHALNAECLELFTQAVESRGGQVVKRIGDAVLSVFDEAQPALDAALASLDALANPETPWSGRGLHARAGINHGPVIEDGGDVYGDVVNVAARLVNLASADEVLLSEAAFGGLADEARGRAQRVDALALRGKDDMIATFRFRWTGSDPPTEDTGLTSMGDAEPTLLVPRRLRLRLGEQFVDLGPEQRRARLGRSRDNDIVVSHPSVSRAHAEVLLRGHSFVLVDKSVNATSVRVTGSSPVRSVREQVTLVGRGAIVLGRADEDVIHFDAN